MWHALPAASSSPAIWAWFRANTARAASVGWEPLPSKAIVFYASCWWRRRRPRYARMRVFAKSINTVAIMARKQWPRWRRLASWRCDSTGCYAAMSAIRRSFISRATRGCPWASLARNIDWVLSHPDRSMQKTAQAPWKTPPVFPTSAQTRRLAVRIKKSRSQFRSYRWLGGAIHQKNDAAVISQSLGPTLSHVESKRCSAPLRISLPLTTPFSLSRGTRHLLGNEIYGAQAQEMAELLNVYQRRAKSDQIIQMS